MNMSGDVFSVSTNPTSSFSHELESSSNPNPKSNSSSNPTTKRKRNLPGTPDPDAEIIALSPKTLMATNRFICEICNKGFQRDQNLQLHRRGHNLPWKLKQRANKDQIKKKVYLCPEKTCVHHDPGRALGDLTGIKKHFFRKHGEKKWKCEKCSKKYAVQSDWKAHSKTCGTREYKCDCGTMFSRKDSFITHRAFCDALAEESTRITNVGANNLNFNVNMMNHQTNLPHGFTNPVGLPHLGPSSRPEFGGSSFLGEHHQQIKPRLSLWLDQQTNSSNHIDHHNSNGLFAPSSNSNSTMGFTDMMQQMASNNNNNNNVFGSMGNYANLSLSPQGLKEEQVVLITNKGTTNNNSMAMAGSLASLYNNNNNNSDNNNQAASESASASMSATALLQKAASMGSTKSNATTFSSGARGHINNRSELHQVFDNMSQSNYSHDDHGLLMHGVEINSLTRDFLGVGGGEVGPFMRQELAKFASMSTGFDTHH
ncbi:hypothetical protein ACJIZ3_021946 [Penstemon smallii]|uniref:C2H2-type domain-containing protein n=1 Tax=Penstemon smallii TaxID=265156 RepID=A0ABD3SMW2_9LAMI